MWVKSVQEKGRGKWVYDALFLSSEIVYCDFLIKSNCDWFWFKTNNRCEFTAIDTEAFKKHQIDQLLTLEIKTNWTAIDRPIEKDRLKVEFSWFGWLPSLIRTEDCRSFEPCLNQMGTQMTEAALNQFRRGVRNWKILRILCLRTATYSWNESLPSSSESKKRTSLYVSVSLTVKLR